MGLLLLLAWFVMAIVGAFQLEPHGRTGQGFAWAFFFGPFGLLATVIIRGNLDREKVDREALELQRHALATREEDLTRAVTAALAAHLANERENDPPASEPAAPAPAVTPPATPTPLPARSYEEIVASEPNRPPRRFR